MRLADLDMPSLRALCHDYKVKELYAFGSIVSGRATATSDLDFLVKFDRSEVKGAFDQFMGFKTALEEIYARPVDLLTVNPFRNHIFQAEIDRSKELIYAA
jgi:predicted nucleotidyltransferase